MKVKSRSRSRVVVVVMAAALVASPLVAVSMSVVGCVGQPVFLSMEDYQRDLLFSAGMLAISLLNGNGGGVGQPGPIYCWDQNVNGKPDAEEDVNQDGVVNVLDCQGPQGEPGVPIPPVSGLSCWDLNGNGQGDPDEDINKDGKFDAFDCRGPAGTDGRNGSNGTNGTNGTDGANGDPGPEFVDVFIDDFFSYATATESAVALNYTRIDEPLVTQESPTAFRVAIPEIYDFVRQNPLTLRVFLWMAKPETCTTLRLDIFRLIPNGGIEAYGSPRWLRLQTGDMAVSPGMLVIDLPLNTAAGLDFPDDLYAPQMLAFELGMFEGDFGVVVLGAELFESAISAGTINVEVFTDDYEVNTFCDVGCTDEGDDDGDRVLNCLDVCPDTPLYARVDAVGCPVSCESDPVCYDNDPYTIDYCQPPQAGGSSGYCVNEPYTPPN